MAEFIADIFLCPLEATRIRLVSEPTFAKGVMDGMPKLAATEGMMKGFYSGADPCPNAPTYTPTANTTTSFSLFPTRRHQRRNCKPCKSLRHARWGRVVLSHIPVHKLHYHSVGFPRAQADHWRGVWQRAHLLRVHTRTGPHTGPARSLREAGSLSEVHVCF